MARPPIDRLGGHGVDVAVEQQRLLHRCPTKRATSCGRPSNPIPGDVERLALELRTLELDQLGLGAGRREPLRRGTPGARAPAAAGRPVHGQWCRTRSGRMRAERARPAGRRSHHRRAARRRSVARRDNLQRVGSAPVRAAVLYEFDEPLVVEEVELDAPKDGRDLRSGWPRAASATPTSTSSRTSTRRPLPAILGHEGAGVVEEIGPGVTNVEPGDHVHADLASLLRSLPLVRERAGRTSARTSPGTTRRSRTGRARFHIGERRIHHYNTSSFAERSVVPARTAIPVDPSLPLHRARADGLRGDDRRRRRAQHGPRAAGRDRVAVVGCGGVGLNVIQGAAIAGAQTIIAVDVVPAKLETRGRSARPTPSTQPPSTRPKRCRTSRTAASTTRSRRSGGPRRSSLRSRLTGRGGQAILVGMAPPEARIPFDALTLTLEERAVRAAGTGRAVRSSTSRSSSSSTRAAS